MCLIDTSYWSEWSYKPKIEKRWEILLRIGPKVLCVSRGCGICIYFFYTRLYLVSNFQFFNIQDDSDSLIVDCDINL